MLVWKKGEGQGLVKGEVSRGKRGGGFMVGKRRGG